MSLAAHGPKRRRLAGESAAKYAQAYSLHHGYYPGINTATMALLAGDVLRSLDLTAFFVPVDLRELTLTGGAEDGETWIRCGTGCFQVEAD